MDAITVFDLAKQYDDKFVLRNLNLQIPDGIAMGVVGKKGAGKTTLVRLLAGLGRPTAGECELMGYSPVFEAEKLHSVTGVVLDSARLYENMTVMQNLSFFASLHDVESNDVLDNASLLLKKLGIWESRDIKISDLPTNVIRRAGIARALIHRPRVLLVDEPVGGFHNETIEATHELFTYLVREEGATVVVFGEDMDYAEGICDSFAILKEGELLARGDMETLRKSAGARLKVSMRLKEGESALRGFRSNNGLWEKAISSEGEIPALVSQTINAGKSMFEVNLIRPTLEEIYQSFINGGNRKAGDFDEQGNAEQEELAQFNTAGEQEHDLTIEEVECEVDKLDDKFISEIIDQINHEYFDEHQEQSREQEEI